MRGVEAGHYANCEGWQDGQPKLDLHNFSEGVAETAVRWWLQERVPGMESAPDRLLIVTGWGKSRGALQQGDVRARVARVLDDLGVPTIATANPGWLVVDARAWRGENLDTTKQVVSIVPTPT